MDRYSVIVVGGGVVGSSIAMALSRAGVQGIAVVDVDLSGLFSSSERNAGGVRATWWHEVNVRLSLESIRFFESVAEEVGFRQVGYLWLQGEADWSKVQERFRSLEGYGLNIEFLGFSELQKRFPFLDRMEGIHGATFSPLDGLINPNLLKAYYRRLAEGKGVLFLDRLWVHRVQQQGGIVQGIECRDLQDITPEGVEEILVKGDLPFSKPTRLLSCDILINAAGAWAGPLASLYGQKLPTVPVRRQVAILHSSELNLSPYGMVVDVSGLYFHPEGGNILAGYANPDEPEGYNLTSSGQGFFQEEIWPRLYARSTRFERLKYIGGWAGLYEKSQDRSAIVGRVQGFSNLYEAHSFSGHGVMQSYAVGRGLAELITRGRYETVNLSPLRGERFREGQSVFEELFI